jgi:hypothetical protein
MLSRVGTASTAVAIAATAFFAGAGIADAATPPAGSASGNAPAAHETSVAPASPHGCARGHRWRDRWLDHGRWRNAGCY